MSSRVNHRLAAVVGLIALTCATPAAEKKDVFHAPGRNQGVWRLTFEHWDRVTGLCCVMLLNLHERPPWPPN